MGEDNRLRKKQFLLRLAESEQIMLKDKAEYCGLTQTEFLRKMVRDGVIVKVDTELWDKIYFVLRNISTNVNQVATFVNSTKMFSRIEFAQLQDEYESLIGVIEKYVLDV